MSFVPTDQTGGLIGKQRLLLIAGNSVFSDCFQEITSRYVEYEVILVPSLEEASALVRKESFSLIIIDIMGRELCSPRCWRFSRSLGAAAPVIIVVDPDACPIITIQVGIGPNEYILRPFRLGDLLERINTLLTIPKINISQPYEIGILIFEPIKNLVRNKVTGVSERLTEKERLILEILCHAKMKSVSRDSLLKRVWGYQVSISTHTLETHVYRLRKKLQVVSEREDLIVTTPKGYKLHI